MDEHHRQTTRQKITGPRVLLAVVAFGAAAIGGLYLLYLYAIARIFEELQSVDTRWSAVISSMLDFTAGGIGWHILIGLAMITLGAIVFVITLLPMVRRGAKEN